MPNTDETTWVSETPYETGYSLYMYGSGGDSLQEIDLTRDEFLELKQVLAARRGLTLESPPSEPVRRDDLRTSQVAIAEGERVERDSRVTKHSCSDILTVTEGLAALGECHIAYTNFVDDAEPAELRWLADVLTYRTENPRARLDECCRL